MSYIKSVSATNVGPFRNLKINFNEKINVIVGPNSCGKSTVLKTIAMCFTQDPSDFRLHSQSSFMTEIGDTLSSNGFFLGVDTDCFSDPPIYKKVDYKRIAAPRLGLSGALFQKSVTIQDLRRKASASSVAPLFVGPQRSIEYQEIKGMTRERSIEDSVNFYRAQSTALLRNGKVPSPKQWLINRYFTIDKEWAYTLKRNYENVLNSLHLIGPRSSDFRFHKIERDLEPQFILNGNMVYLEELSSGFQSILSLVFAIVNWIESINPEEQNNIENAKGTVLIDEIDAHLHPEWQQSILDSLRQLFPNLQFILTTHSPHIASSCGEGELIVIPRHNGEVYTSPSENAYTGWGVESTLIELMGLRSLRKEEFEIAYEKARRAIKDKNEESFKTAISILEKIVPPDDPTPQVLRLQFSEKLLRSK